MIESHQNSSEGAEPHVGTAVGVMKMDVSTGGGKRKTPAASGQRTGAVRKAAEVKNLKLPTSWVGR